MTSVHFYSGVADRLGFTCRLLRKAYRQGARVVVRGSDAQLARLDQALWTFEPLEFVPHARLAAGREPDALLARTPLWLVDDGAEPPSREVLLNLRPEADPEARGFARVLEVVSDAETERAAARERWRAYRRWGCELTDHPSGATA